VVSGSDRSERGIRFERANFESWEAAGSKTLVERAAERVETTLAEHRPMPLSPEARDGVRAVIEAREGAASG